MSVLRKVVDYALSLEDGYMLEGTGGRGIVMRAPGGENTWHQGAWMRPLDKAMPSLFGEMTITSRGTEYQGHPCRSAACVAGHAIIMLAPDGTKVSTLTHTVTLPTGEERHLTDYACELLDITREEGLVLFAAWNGRQDVERITAAIEKRRDGGD